MPSKITNEKGIALITALMFTCIGLVISMAHLYSVLGGIRTSAALKRYRSATDAAYGGTDIVLKDIITTSFGYNDYLIANPGAAFADFMKNSMAQLSSASFSSCMQQRLTTPSTQWTGACANPDLNPKNSPDITFLLNASSGTGTPYKVYSKVVKTMERTFLELNADGTQQTVVSAGNSDTSSVALDGGSTTDGQGVVIPHYPYIYRIEVQGEQRDNPKEKSNISVMYAY